MFKIITTMLIAICIIIATLALLMITETFQLLIGFSEKVAIRCKFCNKIFNNYTYYIIHTLKKHHKEVEEKGRFLHGFKTL